MSTDWLSVGKYTGCPLCPAGQLGGSLMNRNKKKSILIKTVGPNIKTGGLTGYNREIALFEAVNL